jgi:signal transduction histidine kinase
VLADALASVNADLQRRQQRLTVSGLELDIPLRGDAERLTQVLTNLLSNSVRYTHEGGEISVAASINASGDTLSVAIRDNGKGIAAVDLPHVCNLFAQSSTPTPGERGGLGIGLAVVKRIVELHGGTVHIDSAGVGMGTTATVRLPLR